MKNSRCFLGLDLGQSRDFTALAALEKEWMTSPKDEDVWIGRYTVHALRRWPLQTSYTDIVTDMERIVNKILVNQPHVGTPYLAVDQTGVGRPVVDLLKKQNLPAALRPIVITGGHEVTISPEDGSWHVPKKDLVSAVSVLLMGRRLAIDPMKEQELITKELLNFKVKITINANETFEAWRTKDNDDLVLAVAMACWLGERQGSNRPPVGSVKSAHENLQGRFRREWNQERRGLFGLGREREEA